MDQASSLGQNGYMSAEGGSASQEAEEEDDIEAYVKKFMTKEKEKGNDTFTIDMSSSGSGKRGGGGFRSPSYTVLRKDIPQAKEAPKAKAALPTFEKPAPVKKKKAPAPAPTPAPAPVLEQPVRLPPVQPIAPKITVKAKEPEPEPDEETPRLYVPLSQRLKTWLEENGEPGEVVRHIRSKFDFTWDYAIGPIPDLNPMELGEGPIQKMQLEKRQKDFCICMALQDSLPCTIKQVRNQLQKEGGHNGVTEEEWMETAKQLYEDNRCNFGFTTAGVPFEVWF